MKSNVNLNGGNFCRCNIAYASLSKSSAVQFGVRSVISFVELARTAYVCMSITASCVYTVLIIHHISAAFSVHSTTKTHPFTTA